MEIDSESKVENVEVAPIPGIGFVVSGFGVIEATQGDNAFMERLSTSDMHDPPIQASTLSRPLFEEGYVLPPGVEVGRPTYPFKPDDTSKTLRTTNVLHWPIVHFVAGLRFSLALLSMSSLLSVAFPR